MKKGEEKNEFILYGGFDVPHLICNWFRQYDSLSNLTNYYLRNLEALVMTKWTQTI